GLNIEVMRRPDGRAYLQLKSDRVINDPFLDLILEANWASGRIVRDYTLLFDPPGARQAPPGVVTAPQAAATAAIPSTLSPRAQPVPLPPAGDAVATAPRPSPIARPANSPVAPTPKPAVAAPPKPSTNGNTLTVKSGDTAGHIAASIKPANVSLDQMLVALMRANPDAFLRGNINRLRAGAVLDLPDSAAAEAIPADEARQTIIAQSRDFNDFRRKLASNAPRVNVEPAKNVASGKVQTEVEEKKASAATPDKLTLSKGALQAKSTDKPVEDKIAEERQAKAQSERVAELSKNISDLTKISSATAKPAGTPAPTPAAAPAEPAKTAPTAPPAAPPAAPSPAPAPTPAPTPAPAQATPPTPAAPPAAPAKPPAAPPPPPPEDDGILGMLGDDPMVPAAGGGILALLAGFGLYRYMKRRRTAHVDSSFLESRLQPDSFFGASGGQRVDTSDSSSGSSSMAYSPSQLDAGDVDPVAEADVYLAYGRDLQAEEILKEALKLNPSRVAIHAKLAEIHAKRKDIPAFNALAMEAFKLTQGSGPEWERIRDLGRELDPGNALYGDPTAAPSPEALSASSEQLPATAAGDLDLDLDLDLPLDEPAAPAAPLPAIDPFADLNLDLDPAPPAPPAASAEPVAAVPDVPPAVEAPAPLEVSPPAEDPFNIDLEQDLDFPSAKVTEPAALSTPASQAADAHDSGMIEFDLDSLSLDLEGTLPPADKAASPAPSPVADDDWTQSAKALEDDDLDVQAEDPLATKLALAEEFNAIGDADGARALIEEVIAEASGSLKAKAQRLLAQLD
ncbi:MAG: hypothetical protein JOY84_02990, partial [Curvibacter sp.]|nr:hypothetical protein [Curvibacter sp.]